MRVVMKFGGTSVGSIDAIRSLIAIVRDAAADRQVAAIVSAMNTPDFRTTNALIAAAHAAAAGDETALDATVARILSIYMQVALELLTPQEAQKLETELQAMLNRVATLGHSIAVLGELTPRALDLISGQGERCSARLIAAALRCAGIDAEAVDAGEVIITTDRYGDAAPLVQETREAAQQRVVPLLERGCIPVITGFIGATPAGVPTTLGRGGSDYSCSILGAALDADEIWFWKEVNGIMTANPALVPDAQTLPELSYAEMNELAYYGASVLHPMAVRPVVQRGIPIRILNTFNPAHPGTRITSTPRPGTVKAVTVIKDISLITIGGPGMLGLKGIAARIFGAIAHAEANVLLIVQSSSEQDICVAVPRNTAASVMWTVRRELASDFAHQDVEHVNELASVAVLAVVGAGMRSTANIAGRLFGALGGLGINVISIAQGSTETNISVVVAAEDADVALRAVHSAFGLARI